MTGRAPALLAGLVFAAALPAAAFAQTAPPPINNNALDALSPKPATPKPAPRPQTRPAEPRPTPAPAPPPPRRAPVATPVPPRPPTVPIAPPAIAAIPPPISVPVQRPPDPPPVPVAADAPGEASPVAGGVRATFGADRADLNTVTEAAIRSFARPLKATQQAVNVAAYAAGSADDPSTPRRLSLARALAARAVLINEGIPSTRIYVRALGPGGGDGPPDRVDVSTTGAQP